MPLDALDTAATALWPTSGWMLGNPPGWLAAGSGLDGLLARAVGDGDHLPVCFFIGLVATVLIVAVAMGGNHNKQLNSSFARFARQFRGTFRPADWSELPAVSFEHNGSAALLDVTRPALGRSRWCTQITFAFRRAVPVSLEIDPDGIDKPQLRMLRMTPTPVGDAAFDHGHRVYSSDARLARELLTLALREDLIRLRENLRASVNICVSRDYLLVRFPGRIRDFAELMVFAHVAFQLHDQLLLVVNQASPDEVRIVDVASPDQRDRAPGEVRPPAKCGVCGELTLEDVVLCRCCRAPHHHDCWEYNRGCSVYACRERTYIRPAETCPDL